MTNAGKTLSEKLAEHLWYLRNTNAYLVQWAGDLSGTVTLLKGFGYRDNLAVNIPIHTGYIGMPGLKEHAAIEFNNVNYDLDTELTATVAALQAILDWLNVHLPSNTPANTTYTTTQTAPLLTLIQAAQATITV